MKTIALPVLIVLALLAPLTGSRVLNSPDQVAIGGTYVLQGGQQITGNLILVFAQFTLEDGATLDGRIVSVSSVIDLRGRISGDVLAFDSDLTIRNTARMSGSPKEIQAFPYVILLPEIARAGSLANPK